MRPLALLPSLLLALLLVAPGARACDAPALRFEPLAQGLWWIPGAAGDADEHNRGQVSNLLLAARGDELWLIGSGPSPAFGRTLACLIERRFGRRVTDVISPWPHPEVVLGLAGLGQVRSWAHVEVADAMRERCPGCVARMRERLGAAALDLGDDPVRVPTRHLRGQSGRLGPWHWWRLARGKGTPVTVWQLDGTDLRFAPGLLWGSGVPDGRDADIAKLGRATLALAALDGQVGAMAPARWLGEQGPVLGPDAARRQANYWVLLQSAVREAIARGLIEPARPGALAGLAEAATDARHALNWQRAWRQEEERWFQRSLR